MKRGLTLRALLASLILGAVVVGGFVVLTVAYVNLHNEEQHDNRTDNVLVTSDALKESVLNLETGLRGYLLSGKPLFLQPYQAASTGYPVQARELAALTAGDPALHARALRLGAEVRSYVRTWTGPVIRLSRSSLAAGRRAEAGGGGRRRVDAISRQFTVLNDQVVALTAAQRSASGQTVTLTFVLGLAGFLLSVILIAMFAVALHRSVVLPVHRLAAAMGRLRRGDLSARVPVRGAAEIGELAAGFNSMAGALEAGRDEVEQQNNKLQGQRIELERVLVSVQQQKDRAQGRQRFSARLAGQRGVEALAQVSLREIADQAAAQVGAVYVLNEQTGALTCRAARGVRATDFPAGLVPGEGLAGRAVAERRPVAGSSPETSLRLPPLTGGRAVRHELHLPLQHRDQVIGVLSLGRSADAPFGEAEIAALTELTESAALACAEALSLRRLETVATELQSLMDATDEGIYRRDLSGRITFINQAALDQTGYTADELLGQDAHQMLHHSHPDGSPLPAADCPLLRVVHERAGARFQGDVFWRQDGSPFPVDWSAFPLFDGDTVTGVVVSFRDTSDARLAEHQRAVQYQTARLLAEADSVADVAPQVLALLSEQLGWQICIAWRVSADGRELHCTAAHAQPGHGDQLALLSHETVTMGQGTAGQAWLSREPAATPAGQPAEVAIPIVREGRLAAVIQLVGNQNPRMEGLAETIQTIAAQLAQFADRKESDAAAARIKDQFVATVSHELRTPLAAMDGWLHILLDGDPGPLNADQRKFLTTIKRNSDRLMRLVGDLLLIGQMDAGRLSLELGQVDLAELVAETAALFAGPAAEKNIELTAVTGPGALVSGDRLRLGQLLSNLVSNAVKFTPEGGQVRVSVVEHGGSGQVQVSDSGVGIPPGERARLFERFYRASTASGTAGSGLGLAISRALAQAHGGTLRLADSAGPGTTFILDIPLLVGTKARL
ncbi:MAG TPA: ATP-binding protein [Streptosporangiaceae bacterium]|nr:ATP-binding protein [Streptosporangiaceae bacterium]